VVENKHMKKFFVIVLVFMVVILTTLVVAEKSIIAPKLKEILEKKASEALGAPLRLESVDIEFFPPISLVIKGINFAQRGAINGVVTIPMVQVVADFKELFDHHLT